MTDKPDKTGAEPEQAAEQTSFIATSDRVTPADPAATDEPRAADPADTPLDPDETVATTPPPWQRVTADENAADPEATTTVKVPQPEWPKAEDATVAVERPVVTGAAAPPFTPPPTTTPPLATDQPGRTAVHLDGNGGIGTTPGVTPPRAAPSALRRPGRGPRRANLQVKRFDPWSVLKLSLVLGVALFFVWLVAVGALYAVLDGMGVWDKVNGISSELLNANSDNGSSGPLISAGRVFGISAIIGAINIILFSALATVGAFVYNVSADLAGGLEVTLAERE